MIVNSEWGNFDQKLQYLPTTTYDIAIDVGSVNPGFEMFEKRISGMYLGEILRLVLLSLLESPALKFFAGVAVPKTSRLYLQWGLDSSFMSYLENDNSPGLSISKTKIEEWLGIPRLSLEVVEAIRTISHAIGRRSARLSAVAIGAVLVQTNCLLGEDRIDIGVDGSLIELYPGYTAEIRRALKCVEQIGEKCEARIDITIAKDGSGVGAALAAYIAANTLKC
jgi:hexokinase